MDLSNFYDDYAFNIDEFKKMVDIYGNTVANLLTYLYPLQDNRIIKRIEDFRHVPIQYIDISSALYDITTILSEDELRSFYDKELPEKIEILRQNGKYIQLIADRQLVPTEQFEGDAPIKVLDESGNKIVNFRLIDTQKNYELVAGIDYYYQNNQLFMLGDYADINLQNTMLKMADIAIDFDTVRDLLQSNLELPYHEDEMSKIEFNDFVKTLTLAAIKGFKLDEVNYNLNLLDLANNGIEVFDKTTPDAKKAEMWNSQKYGLGPFDYVIYYPVDFDAYKVSLISKYLSKTQHKYTHYHAMPFDRSLEAYIYPEAETRKEFIYEKSGEEDYQDGRLLKGLLITDTADRWLDSPGAVLLPNSFNSESRLPLEEDSYDKIHWLTFMLGDEESLLASSDSLLGKN